MHGRFIEIDLCRRELRVIEREKPLCRFDVIGLFDRVMPGMPVEVWLG